MDSRDLALVTEQLRQMMTRLAALDTTGAIPGLDSKLASLAGQIESLKSLVADAPPTASEDDEPDVDAPEEIVAKPAAVSMRAFAAENTPPLADVRSLIVSLLPTGGPASDEDRRSYEEDESVWKLDWSVMPGSGIRPPSTPPESDPTDPEPREKKDLWDDLSEHG